MVARAANARYANIPSSGHQMPVEVPEIVADAILGVLDELALFDLSVLNVFTVNRRAVRPNAGPSSGAATTIT